MVTKRVLSHRRGDTGRKRLSADLVNWWPIETHTLVSAYLKKPGMRGQGNFGDSRFAQNSKEDKSFPHTENGPSSLTIS